MSIRINSNQSSLNAQRYLARATDALGETMVRLSSGQRINTASDDAAGLAIASSLRLESRVYGQAMRNVSDGVSMLSIAQGALEQLSSISIRQLELAEQSANGTYTIQQRQAMHQEANQLVEEWNRITETTKFNGIAVFDTNNASLRIQAGFQVDGSLRVGLSEELARTVGTGTFTISQTFNAPAGAGFPALADIDGDGITDLIGARDGWRKGVGDGTFGAANALSQTSGQSQFFLADFNNDGKADLVTTTVTDVNLSLGFGNGTFGTTQTLAVTAPTLPSFGDINGDGALDIVVGDYNGGSGTTIKVFTNTGNGIFSTNPLTLSAGTGPYESGIGDFNGDGRADIAVTSRTNNTVGIRYGDGRGSFSAETTLGLSGLTSASGLSVTDFNNDGYDDFVVTGSAGARVVLSNGNGTFTAARTLAGPIAGFGQSPDVGDITGDGYDDIVIADTTANSIYTWVGNGDGTFLLASTLTSPFGNAVQSPVLGHINRDGVLDIVASTNAGNNFFAALSETRESATSSRLNLMTQANAREMIGVIRGNLDRVTSELGALGAYQSRLEVAANTLRVIDENSQGAASRIIDADVALETATYTQKQILQRAASAVLSQANVQPRLALQLIQG